MVFCDYYLFIYSFIFIRLFHPQAFTLTLSCRRPLLYRNQFIYLPWKSLDWFLYDEDLRHERVRELRKSCSGYFANLSRKYPWRSPFLKTRQISLLLLSEFEIINSSHPWNDQKNVGFLMISLEIKVNQFSYIHLILEAKLWNDQKQPLEVFY